MAWPELEVSTTPTLEPVSLEDAKVFINYTDDDQDTLISSLITAAREEVERETQLALIQQTLKLYLDDFPAWEIELRKPPVSSLTSVAYTDSDGTSQTVSSANYQTDLKSYPARLWPAYGKVWPTDVKEDTVNAVTVTFVAGYGATPSSVPERAKLAVMLRVRAMFDGCDSGMQYRSLVDSLSWNRVWG